MSVINRGDGSVVTGLNRPYLCAMPTVQLNTDVALGVAIPSRNARGRIARLGPVVDSILALVEVHVDPSYSYSLVAFVLLGQACLVEVLDFETFSEVLVGVNVEVGDD